MRGIALGVALGLWAGSAAAQHVNDAQQIAYAKAYQGRWVNKGNSVEMDVKNDGKEVRFTLATITQQLGNAGYKMNDVVYQGSFAGPDFKGWTLMAMGGDANQRAAIRLRCNGADHFWVNTTGKMNFDRNQIAMTQPAFVLVHHSATNKCETIDANDKRYADVSRNPAAILSRGAAMNSSLTKKPQ